MRRLLGGALAVLLLLQASPRAVTYIAFEQVTVAASSIGFSTAKILPDGAGSSRQATLASCRLELAEIRFTIDGTTPTAAVGTLLEPNDVLTVTGYDSISRFRGFRTTGTSAQLSCTYSAP